MTKEERKQYAHEYYVKHRKKQTGVARYAEVSWIIIIRLTVSAACSEILLTAIRQATATPQLVKGFAVVDMM